jgi:hypothetical protein
LREPQIRHARQEGTPSRKEDDGSYCCQNQQDGNEEQKDAMKHGPMVAGVDTLCLRAPNLRSFYSVCSLLPSSGWEIGVPKYPAGWGNGRSSSSRLIYARTASRTTADIDSPRRPATCAMACTIQRDMEKVGVCRITLLTPA